MNEIAKVSQPSADVRPPENAQETKPTQYKATKIWYEIINSFHESIPLKKHWRNFRTYSDCFTATEAVEWLFRYLKSSQNFKSHTSITRQQAIQLMQIFLKEKIIEDVRSSDSKFTFKEFQDDDRLYRFGTNKRFFKSIEKSTAESEVKLKNLEFIEESEKNSLETIKSYTKASSTSEFSATVKENLKLVSVSNKENNLSESLIVCKNKIEATSTVGLMSIKSNLQINTDNSPTELQTNSYNKMFDSKLNSSKLISSKRLMIQRAESLKRRPVNAKSHHYNHGKLIPMKLTHSEEDIWSRVAQKLLESIIKKGLNANENYDFSNKKASSSVLLEPRQLKKYDSKLHSVNSLLFEEGYSPVKVVSGANIHHNCTHVNKHGVVIDTDDDFPAWLIKAMTCLMNWKEEPGEYLQFKDVFAEVNNHFNDLTQPLITPQVACLLRNIMALLLLPDRLLQSHNNDSNSSVASSCYYTAHTTNNSDYSNISVQHNEFNKNTLDSLHSVKSHMTPISKSKIYDEEETKLLEKAKLPIIEPVPIGSSIFDNETALEQKRLIHDIFLASIVELDECCEDCLQKYKAIHDFVNKNAIEFNEFMYNLNYLDDGNAKIISDNAKTDTHKDIPYDIINQNVNSEEYLAALHIKESRERFASLKLKFSPIKKDIHVKTDGSSIDKRLHRRNNSFRTAIGDIFKNESTEQQACKIQKTCPTDKKSIYSCSINSFKIPYSGDSLLSDTSSICKSFSLNSIASNFSQANEHKSSSYLTYHNYKSKNQTNRIGKPILKPMKSYNDLCCLGGFDTNRKVNKYFSQSISMENMKFESSGETNNAFKMSVNTFEHSLATRILKSDAENERQAFLNSVFSLSNEIESETLCFMIKAFRICALMLPPSSKRKLHLLLRFLYKLRYDQNSCKHLIENDELINIKKKTSMVSILEDVHYIDESIINFSKSDINIGMNKRKSKLPSSTQSSLKHLNDTSKAIEKIIIESFFKSIIPLRISLNISVKKQISAEAAENHFSLNLSPIEEEQLAMKLVQILINNYPEIMRIPDDLITNVNYKFTSSKSSGSLHRISISNNTNKNDEGKSKTSLQQYECQTAEKSKQQLTELLNNILTDVNMKNEEKILRLKNFKDQHADVYEEKYPTIKKALNIIGLDESTSFLVPDINILPKSCFLSESSASRRESDYYSLKKRTALAKLSDSAKKKKINSNSSYLNHTTIIPSSSSSSSTISFQKFFIKRSSKKENLI